MLTLHFSNHLEPLTALLLQQVPGRHASPFEADEVIVPSLALRRHLTHEIARRHGVCAQVRFAFLAHWLWARIARVVDGVDDRSPVEPSVLRWRILSAFDDATWVSVHPRLQAFLASADEVTRHDLATKVAGLIDQYTTYRPDWLQRWSESGEVTLAGAPADALADQRWQADLWRRLLRDSGATGRQPVEQFLQALQAVPPGADPPGDLPRQLHVFALPAMPPLHLALLQAIGRVCDVHVYALDPCREYWLDVVDRKRLHRLAGRPGAELHEEGHRLLAAWGQQTRAQLTLWVDATGDGVVDDTHHVDNPEGTLLGHLQNSILALADLQPGSILLADDDRSIELHVCHSPTRELEVLHNRLLALFHQDKSLEPGDILVVTPDLEAAAPRIDAVFGTVPRDRHIPFHVSGRARTRVDLAARAFMDLLALAGSRCTASEVFALLMQAPVARRFELDEADLEQVRTWLQEAGVHWALDAAHRAAHGVPAQARHSFDDGLDRLFLGYAVPASLVDAPRDGTLPAGDVEGSQARALGALATFIDALHGLQRWTALPHAAAEWPDRMLQAVQEFLKPEGREIEDVQELRAGIESLRDQFERSSLKRTLPLELVRAALQAELDEPARGGVPGGAVTFSSMSSLRGLPYRVVCVIGLDDGAYPSASPPMEFDLMALQGRPGDRQRRLDERNVFLDLLLAARETLHLSHTGRSVRDNAPLPPSILVSELLDLLVPAIADDPLDDGALQRARRRLVVEHPLQPFSEQGFLADGDRRQASYQREYLEALLASRAGAPLGGPAAGSPNGASGTSIPGHDQPVAADGWPPPVRLTEPRPSAGVTDPELDDDAEVSDADATPWFTAPLDEPAPESRQVSLEQLTQFFAHPARTLLRQRLGIVLPRADDELQDDEPFVAEPRQRTALAQRLLPALQRGVGDATLRELARAGGELPTGAFGERLIDSELAGLRAYVELMKELSKGDLRPPHHVDVELDVDGARWRISGSFSDLRPGGLVLGRYADLGAADRLRAWLHHLVLSLDPPGGMPTQTRWCARDGVLSFEPCAQPRQVMTDLLRVYRRGLLEPLPFFPKSSWTYVERNDNVITARNAFVPTRRAPYAEGADPYIRLAWRGRPDPLGLPDFHDVAHAVFDPLRDCIGQP